jgi:hypothetical protein
MVPLTVSCNQERLMQNDNTNETYTKTSSFQDTLNAERGYLYVTAVASHLPPTGCVARHLLRGW